MLLKRVLFTARSQVQVPVFRYFSSTLRVATPRTPSFQFLRFLNPSARKAFDASGNVLPEKLSHLSNPDLKELLEKLRNLPLGSSSIGTEFATVLVNELVFRYSTNQSILLDQLLAALRLHTHLTEAGVDLLEIMQSHGSTLFTHNRVDGSEIDGLMAALMICWELERVPQTKYHKAISASLMNLIEWKVAQPAQARMADWQRVLEVMMDLNAVSEQSLRLVEKQLVSQLQGMKDHYILAFTKLYAKRQRPDHQYLVDCIFDPIVSELLSRESQISLKFVSEFLKCMWLESNINGTFFNSTVEKLITATIDGKARISASANRDYFLQIASSYLANVCSSPPIELMQKISLAFCPSVSEITSLEACRTASSLARAGVFEPKFWDRFVIDVDQMERSQHYSLHVHSLLMTLQLKNNALHQRYSQAVEKYLPVLAEKWKSGRNNEYPKPAALTDKIERYMIAKKLAFQQRVFDGYVIDFALTDHKIAISICLPKDYEIPSEKLSSRRQAAHDWLRSRQWKVAPVPAYLLLSDSADSSLDSILAPLLVQ